MVKVTPAQEEQLQRRARDRGVSISRLLVENTLSTAPDYSSALIQQIVGLRRQLAQGNLHEFEVAFVEMLER